MTTAHVDRLIDLAKYALIIGAIVLVNLLSAKKFDGDDVERIVYLLMAWGGIAGGGDVAKRIAGTKSNRHED